MFERIKKWYKQGLWDEAKVLQAAEKGVITADQAAVILGQNVG